MSSGTEVFLLQAKTPCPRCGGRQFLDSWIQSCRKCKENGASRCDNCWVHLEWNCANCGGVQYLPRMRRRDMRKMIRDGGAN